MLGYVMLLVRNTALYGVPSGEPLYEVQDIQVFNSQFINFIGNQRASTVIRLIQMINASNYNYDEYQVKYTGPDLRNIATSKTYTVELKYDNTGIVCEVIVTEAGVENVQKNT
ncbi:MAG: hypothetical protein HFJ50_09865 [Clostridia bacterium]|jgi:hypothetical protein|nr:hypothetical protein [Clostridia bacterium]